MLCSEYVSLRDTRYEIRSRYECISISPIAYRVCKDIGLLGVSLVSERGARYEVLQALVVVVVCI